MPFTLLKKTNTETITKAAWRVLIVDDEQDIHSITELALKRFELEDKRVEFLHAYSGQEAREIIQKEHDIALIFLDVVMETDDAGLLFAKWLRDEHQNHMTRIVLRTGQPGQAPEEDVIMRYDINDYKQKTELDRTKLFTTVVTALRAYRDLKSIEASRNYEKLYRQGLEKVISSTGDILEHKTLQQFFNGLLEQIISLFHIHEQGVFINVPTGMGTIFDDNDFQVIAQCGEYAGEGIDDAARVLLDKAKEKKESILEGDAYVAYFPSSSDKESMLYLKGICSEKLTDVNIQLLKVFCHSIGIAFDNLLLNREILNTQEELIERLGNAVESRSKESGNHIRRMAKFSEIIALKMGMSESDCEILRQATPMHDVGKIATPDAILLKPGRLLDDEMDIMKKHTSIGFDILQGSQRPILKAAAIISQQHHEKYDGSGYPQGLKGEDIHIYARIVAVSDVFDALIHRRCYKEPWPLEKVLDLLEKEKGKHFDPAVVDALMQSLDDVLQINEALTCEGDL